MNIYIIEDDLTIAENLKENLQELGYQVVCIAKSASEVQSTLKKANPDLCLVDIYINNRRNQ